MYENVSGISRTRDITHAALLKFKNLPLSRTEWVDGVAWWTFDDPANRGRGIVQAYINGKVTGNLKKFVEAQRTIKQTLNHN